MEDGTDISNGNGQNTSVSDLNSNSSKVSGPYCSICQRPFSKRYALRRHVRSVHNNASFRFHCDFQGCNQSFRRRDILDRHKHNQHGPRKPPCPKCNKFIRRDGLQEHLRTAKCRKAAAENTTQVVDSQTQGSNARVSLDEFQPTFGQSASTFDSNQPEAPVTYGERDLNILQLASEVQLLPPNSQNSSGSQASQGSGPGTSMEYQVKTNSVPAVPLLHTIPEQNGMSERQLINSENEGHETLEPPLRQTKAHPISTGLKMYSQDPVWFQHDDKLHSIPSSGDRGTVSRERLMGSFNNKELSAEETQRMMRILADQGPDYRPVGVKNVRPEEEPNANKEEVVQKTGSSIWNFLRRLFRKVMC